MRIDLSGKTALVTGSTAGIGFGIAQGLAESGATVVLNGRSQASVDAARQALLAAVPNATLHSVVADLGKVAGTAEMIKAVPKADILINNLGIYGPKPFFDITDEDWDSYFQTNVMSGVRLTRHYLKGMLAADWGRVVFISSESALNIPADMIHYGFSKTALLAIARGLAKFAAGTGVTVNSVLPGPTLSDGFRSMLTDTAEENGQSIEEAGAEFVQAERPSSILRRPATVEEVANMVVYACSTQASATTGAALRVDGGVVDTIA